MSVPDLTGDVKRATRLVVSGVLPGSGEPLDIETDAFEARAFQHEIDHLDGLLFLDRVAGAPRPARPQGLPLTARPPAEAGKAGSLGRAGTSLGRRPP